MEKNQGPQIDIHVYRKLVVDWFWKLAEDAGLTFPQSGSSESRLTLGDPNAFHVIAKFITHHPFVEFEASDPARQQEVQALAERAVSLTTSGNLGTLVWYSATAEVPAFSMSFSAGIGAFLEQLGVQTRIDGWRRLSQATLLQFIEEPPEDGQKAGLLAPKAVVHLHFAVPAPRVGCKSREIAKTRTAANFFAFARN
jgi:hypothetical protein